MAESTVPTAAPIYLTIPQNVSDVNRQSKRDRMEKLFPKKTILTCSILQLICAGTAAITQLILFAVDPDRYSSIADIGTGIWTGVLFGIAGGLGLNASQRPSHCSVIAFMVLSIIASLFAIPLIVISGIGIGIGSDRQYDLMRILCSIQLLTGLLQGVVAITTAAFSCRVVCCGRQRSNMGTVIYTNAVPQSVPLTAVIATGASEASGTSGASVQPTTTVDEKPPKYEDLETDQDAGEGDRYQRFD